MRSYIVATTMYLQCICHRVLVMWSLGPYGASIYGKEALFVAKVVH